MLVIKIFGYLYYTIATTSILFLINFGIRLLRKPNPQFYKNSYISIITVILYSILNLFVFNYFFSSKLKAIFFYILNESITLTLDFFILSGFHVYGITGQICSGKTSACEYLKRKYKVSIISLDEINKQILRDRSIIESIRKEFGDGVLIRERYGDQVNRSELKKIIFNDKIKRKKLEAITHPKIMLTFFNKLFEERFIKRKKYVFIENAILLRFNLFRIILKGVISICVSNENTLIIIIMKLKLVKKLQEIF